MVDRKSSGKFSKQFSSRGSSSTASEYDESRLQLENKYLDNGLQIRPPSGTNHQQPGSHLSIDTRLSELSLGKIDDYHEVNDGSFYESRSHSAPSSKNSHRVQANKPNFYITSPFKQGYQVPRKGPFKVVDPSYDLKNVTKESIARVRQQLRKPRPPPQPSQYTQRLRKARLKTTGRPFSGSGPSIQQCKGIQSGVRVMYGSGQPDLNNGYSRMNSPSLRPNSPTELLRPESSFHCTSMASTNTCSTDESASEDSFEWHAFESSIKYSNFERGGISGRGENSSENQARVQHIIHPHTDINTIQEDPESCNESSSNVGKVNGALSMEEEYYRSSPQDEHEENHEIIPDKKSKRQNQKESIAFNDNKGNDRKHKTYVYSGCKPFCDDGNDDDADDDDDDDDQKRSGLSSYHSTNRTSGHQQNHNPSLVRYTQGAKDERKTSEHKSNRCNHIVSNNAVLCSSTENRTRSDCLREPKVLKKTENYFQNEHIIESSSGVSLPVMTVHVRRKETTSTAKDHKKDESVTGTATNESTNSELEAGALNDMNIDHDIQIPNDDDDINRLLCDDDDDDDDQKRSGLSSYHSTNRTSGHQQNRALNDMNIDHDIQIPNDDDDIDGLLYDDDDDLDTDRIPSAEIWKNLDKLNLSMNDRHNVFDSQIKPEFPALKVRKVQSAGVQRKLLNLNTDGQHSNVLITKPRSRVASAKRRNKKESKPTTDKAELLRKYLSEESSRFSVELRSKLPGYFTEQFDIIQQGKLDNLSVEPDDVQELLENALVKFEEEKLECNYDLGDNLKSELNETEDKRNTALVVPCSDSLSSGVFFTVESTSTCEIDSMSERTEDTTGENSETREFSDDTGFETMPGSTGVYHQQNLRDDVSDDEKSPFKSTDYRQEPINFGKQESLEIIAKPKHLNDPSLSNKKHITSPHEPLKFSINAKPPAGYLFYFAYGVDMSIKRMSIYLRREHKRLWGVLFGFRLRFNKKGSSTDAGGFANVEFCPGSSIEGCVYTLTDAELLMLDNCMGYPKHYTRAVLPVWMCNSYQPSLHGVAQYCVPAVLYVAGQQWIQPDAADVLDNSNSVSQCLKAADLLTPRYLEYLNQLVTSGQ